MQSWSTTVWQYIRVKCLIAYQHAYWWMHTVVVCQPWQWPLQCLSRTYYSVLYSTVRAATMRRCTTTCCNLDTAAIKQHNNIAGVLHAVSSWYRPFDAQFWAPLNGLTGACGFEKCFGILVILEEAFLITVGSLPSVSMQVIARGLAAWNVFDCNCNLYVVMAW